MATTGPMTIELSTITPVWTGGVDQNCGRLHETGLMGSLRWWYEALVRGLNGSACDPTDNSPCLDKNHCIACELFGCTGWSRKFRLRVLDQNKQLIRDALERDTHFQLQFIELRPMEDAEKWLLAKAVEIAAKYGAVGGKTTLKPQRDVRGPNDTLKKFPRTKPGDDMGIVRWITSNNVARQSRTAAAEYLLDKEWRRAISQEWANLNWFFFRNGAHLSRSQLNTMMGRSPDGRHIPDTHDQIKRWLRGDIGVSKKIFSFHADSGRLWGYGLNKTMRDEIIKRLGKELGTSADIKTGEEVISEL
ncbi:MAG: type III-B CRISPR module RAMP protein Cmr1 [Acidobacteria bacterium]|nr:type III-B CRISPR module RAMP protein Cmr1 [Acidobacteriota bacterium]